MLRVDHDSHAHRLSAELDGETGVLTYELAGDVMSITHTRVPKAIGGRGVAADLMRSALDLANAQGWTVKPVCAYAVAYLKRHPEVNHEHLDALLDEAIEESFPASDPPAVGGVD